ncbi:hypothetical protein O7621_15810 [Solwaraspora sp. WMMD937]|uniref:hypothetical protein n=1 Tax=Solwaraspora sp. WMMD937 TaxID=3016090 RepID=UPI00249BC215|nr:hypothetical protein [Solwaraspora sp. WMMD937]WFE19418.1 hypothetical protein O7621_15810 [Solwaraspora sp. WMMD937]
MTDDQAVMNPTASSASPTPYMLTTPPLFAALSPARNVLIAGAGGGFDVYAGLPLAFALWRSTSPSASTRLPPASLARTRTERAARAARADQVRASVWLVGGTGRARSLGWCRTAS